MLHLESRSIPYRLHLQRRRSLRIAVKPDLTVNVFAPVRSSKRQLEEVLQRRAPWIVRTLEKVASCHLLSLPDRFVTGASIPFMGRTCELSVVQGSPRSVKLLFGTLVVTLPDPDDERAVARWVDRWFREQAHEVYSALIQKCLRTPKLRRVSEPTLTVRKMRSRWGSCSSSGRVTLSLHLLMVPETCIEYVVMHELCHLVHHNHSKQYYALLSACMPDWRERKAVLDGFRVT